MLDRQNLTAQVVPIYKAKNHDSLVEIWAMANLTTTPPREGGMVYIHTSKERCSAAKGTPLQPGTKVTISLSKGEILWGVSDANGMEGALVGISVHKLNLQNLMISRGN